MSKPQTKCVFCGGTPATKSHIWPDWLAKLPLPTATHHMVNVGGVETFVLEAEGPAPLTQVRQGRAGARKPRNTCLKCNGGWMSRLEQANKPILSALILGKPALLQPIDQWLLACLLCLITIRLEFTDPQMQAVPPDDHRTLMTRGTVPFETWKIWIARYIDRDHPEDHWAGHLGMQLVTDPAFAFRPHKCNTQVTTIVIGNFLAHLASSTVAPIPEGYHGVNLTRIWPPASFDIESRYMAGLRQRTFTRAWRDHFELLPRD